VAEKRWTKAPYLAKWAGEGEGQGRAYTDPTTGKDYPSVTTVLKNTPKADMMGWAALKVAEVIIDQYDRIGGDPTEVNDEGYGGRMQFGAERLADAAAAGLVPRGTTGAQFAQMPVEQQQRVEDWHFNNIDTRAQQEGLTEYHGRVVAGVPINENSIRAMAHLGGFDGAKRFIETNGRYNPADSNGTRLSDYGRRFGGTR